MYINLDYVYTPYYGQDYKSEKQLLLSLMLTSLLYPCTYDMMQLKNQGVTEYFSDKWNLCDQTHIWGGFLNIAVHFEVIDFGYQFRISLLSLLCVLMLLKTFFFLRIFRSSSHLVIMMIQVVRDLHPFLLFYFFMLWIYSLILS